jgi:predicted dehydrogenase
MQAKELLDSEALGRITSTTMFAAGHFLNTVPTKHAYVGDIKNGIFYNLTC